jgi:hypothetical protein
MTITATQTKNCFDAWMNCEQLLYTLAEVKACFSKKITKTIDECAYICLGTFHAIKSGSHNIRDMVLLCIGICEECAELCEDQYGEDFRECARICRQCSQNLSSLAMN